MLKDAYKPKNYDSIINDGFIQKYKEVMSKRTPNAINFFISEKIEKNSSSREEFSRLCKIWSNLNKEEKKVIFI